MLFNIYTNDQPVHTPTLAASSTQMTCASRRKETTSTTTNQLRANPSKTQMCAFHLSNREAIRELNVVWNGTRLSNTTTPVYLVVHLDRTLCYKTHIEKMKVNARNNIIRKFEEGVQGINTQTQLSRPLLLSCRIRLPCVGKVYTRAQAEPGPT